MKAMRQAMGLSLDEFAGELGYSGSMRNDNSLIRKYERGAKQIPPYIARLVVLLHRFWHEKKCLPNWEMEISQ